MNHRTTALALALAAALALPASTLAASATVTESATVQSQITMTGVPASAAYGAGLGGSTLAAPTMTVSVSTNNPTGFAFAVTAGDFASGSNRIESEGRRFQVLSPDPAPGAWSTSFAAASAYGEDGTRVVLAKNAAAGDVTFGVKASLVLAATAIPGAYTSTATYAADVQP